jgi:phosphoribosylpyrophosphate synthetase
VLTTNSVPPFRLSGEARARVTVLDVAPFLAEAVRRMHQGGSVVDLNEEGALPPVGPA